MLSLFIILMLSIPLADQGANAQIAVRKPGAVLDSLTMIGHASVKIKTSQKQVIYIDPFQPGNYADSADVVLVTHQHGDHNVLGLVKRKPSCTVITNAEALQGGSYKSFTIGGTTVGAVPAYNANHLKSASVGFVVGFNGINLYHAGDTGNIPEMANLAAKNIHYALLPMDGIFNMTPEEAVLAAASIKAAYVIPIHTMPPPDTYDDAIAARFTAPNKLVVKNGQTIALKAATSVGAVPAAPFGFELGQNYPNPFNPATVLSYSVTPPSRIRLAVYNAKGEKVKILVDTFKPAGRHTAVWDGTDSNGTRLGTGVYVAEFVTPSYRQSRKMIFIR